MALVIHPHFHRRYSGATRHVEDIIPALARHTETRALGWLRREGVPRIGWSELLGRARREPIVWHAHRIHELLVGLGLKLWGKDVRLLWTRHSTGRPTTFTRWAAKAADRIIAVSPETAETLGLPAKVVWHGVDLERFQPPADRARAWSSLGVGGRYGIGVVGRIREDKGQGDFVTAVRPLLEKHPDWKAVLVGLAKPADEAWIRKRAEGTGIALVGEQPQVERWYQGLTIAVVPSHIESFGLTRLEAMAAGCCLVTTRLNALDREIEHGRTGYLYDAKDTQSLQALLAELMRDPTKAEQIGQNAAEVARSRFGVEHEARALLAEYAELQTSR